MGRRLVGRLLRRKPLSSHMYTLQDDSIAMYPYVYTLYIILAGLSGPPFLCLHHRFCFKGISINE